jgi:hypothetical protein
MLGVFAEFERSIIQERIHAGIARARVVGTKSGKPIGRARIDAMKVAWSFYPLARARGSACRRGYGVLRTRKAAPHLRFVKKESPRRRGLSLLIPAR